jgi:hypothetical protein
MIRPKQYIIYNLLVNNFFSQNIDGPIFACGPGATAPTAPLLIRP